MLCLKNLFPDMLEIAVTRKNTHISQ